MKINNSALQCQSNTKKNVELFSHKIKNRIMNSTHPHILGSFQ